jgi:hypothetical protein
MPGERQTEPSGPHQLVPFNIWPHDTTFLQARLQTRYGRPERGDRSVFLSSALLPDDCVFGCRREW